MAILSTGTSPLKRYKLSPRALKRTIKTLSFMLKMTMIVCSNVRIEMS